MPSYTATGLVLHRLNTGETDKILTLYTREHGKLAVIAKGARKAGSRTTGATELFTETRFLLGSGRSLEIVQQAEIQQSFPAIRTDLEKLARATYLCELLDRLTAENDALQSAELYDLLLSALYLLQRAVTYPDAVVHAYELHLLASIGYAPALEGCVRCGEPLMARQVGFSPALGGALCPADRYRADDALPLSFDALKLLRLLTATESEQLLALQPAPKVAAEVARAMRWYIRYRSDRDLKSLDFLDSLRMTS
jgi:DNA repair protein RecO (recombination protein O)